MYSKYKSMTDRNGHKYQSYFLNMECHICFAKYLILPGSLILPP